MSTVHSVTAQTLKSWLDEGRGITVIDVLPPEHHDAHHIPGSLNHCVYQVVFLDELMAAIADKTRPLVLYSGSLHCHGARDAADKLLDAGFEDITICQDGLEGWKALGLPLEGGGPEPLSPTDLGKGEFSLSVDPAASRVGWAGRNRNGANWGAAPIAKGEIGFKDGRLASGYFELDMRGLVNENIADQSLAAVLIRHLESRDFFLADVFPVARFEITHVNTLVGVAAGEANFDIKGQLTLRGVTREMCFPATVERLDDGRITAEAHLDVDRTLFGVNYGSGKLFERLGMHLVHDLVNIQIRVVTTAAVPLRGA